MNRLVSKFINLSVFLFLVTNFVVFSPFLSVVKHKTSSFAQTLSPERVSEGVYEQMPDLPKENEYLSQDTGERALKNDLVSRVVRYHQYIKARPTRFRLDWKLTLADYLGKNEKMREDKYPGYSTLQENPFQKDREIINKLTMEEREKLVNALVSVYSPSFPVSNEERSPEDENPSESTTPENGTDGDTFNLPRQGGAELLLP